MNLDDLKNTWKEYDQRLAAQSLLQDKLLKSMMRESSRSVLDNMRREYALTFVGLIFFTAFCILSVVYNAFDYIHVIQYFPLILYVLASFLILLLLGEGFKITRMEIEKEHLLGSLKKVLYLHRKFVSRTGKAKMMFILSGVLFPLSFFSRIYAGRGPEDAAGYFLINLAVVGILIVLFRKTGLFRDRYGEKLESLVTELEEYEETASETGMAR